jgi:hypothetical protein
VFELVMPVVLGRISPKTLAVEVAAVPTVL